MCKNFALCWVLLVRREESKEKPIIFSQSFNHIGLLNRDKDWAADFTFCTVSLFCYRGTRKGGSKVSWIDPDGGSMRL